MRHVASTVKHGYKTLYVVKLENKKLLVYMLKLGYNTYNSTVKVEHKKQHAVKLEEKTFIV